MELTAKQQRAREMVCMPLDGLNSMTALQERVSELNPVVGLFKIGKETYTQFGPPAIDLVHSQGANVFLDLKYHDIPNTVRGAAKAATEQGVYMFNVHASGGIEMMQAAVEGAREGAEKYQTSRPKITAVTVLTSLDNLRYIQNSLPLIKSLPVSEVYKKEALCNFPFLDAINAEIPTFISIQEEK